MQEPLRQEVQNLKQEREQLTAQLAEREQLVASQVCLCACGGVLACFSALLYKVVSSSTLRIRLPPPAPLRVRPRLVPTHPNSLLYSGCRASIIPPAPTPDIGSFLFASTL